jgi:hypothetical protein
LSDPAPQLPNGPVVTLACPVMRGLTENHPCARGIPAEYLRFELHV